MNSSPPAGTSDEVLQHATALLAPLVRLLIHHGVDHPRLAAALKRTFVDAALAECARRGDGEPTHTTVSLLTGLQRRDVKALRDEAAQRFPAKALSPTLPMQAVTRWASDPAYTDGQGRARPLPLRSADPEEPSFELLTDSLSKDIHPTALRDELLRLGLVRDDAGLLTLLQPDFVPLRDQVQLLGAMARNAHDHLAAAVGNLLAGQPRFLEYSLVADELRPESAESLHELARKLWAQAYRRSAQAAAEHVRRDLAQGFGADAPEHRVRFGVYFYAEPVQRPAGPGPAP